MYLKPYTYLLGANGIPGGVVTTSCLVCPQCWTSFSLIGIACYYDTQIREAALAEVSVMQAHLNGRDVRSAVTNYTLICRPTMLSFSLPCNRCEAPENCGIWRPRLHCPWNRAVHECVALGLVASTA